MTVTARHDCYSGALSGSPATTVLLIRHAHTAAIGRWLCGRRPGVPLSDIGLADAAYLGRALARRHRLAAVYTSPIERAMDTAAAIASPQRLTAVACDELSEIDFGEWTGRTFDDLDRDPEWQRFNRQRSAAVIPGGEAPLDAQARVVAGVARLAARHPATTIAVVSHGDPIRFALLHYMHTSVDGYAAVTVEPGSVSAVAVDGHAARILYVNRQLRFAPE